MKFNRKIRQESLIKKLIQVRRVCKVTEGGTTFSFSALVVVGDGNGSANIAMGKAQEISDAVKKAFERASSRKFDYFPLKQKRTVYHEVKEEYCATKILVKPVKKGAGIKVGKMLAPYCEAIGLKEATIKTFGSRNPSNALKALRKALLSMQSDRHRYIKRGVFVDSLNNKKNTSKSSDQIKKDDNKFKVINKSNEFFKNNKDNSYKSFKNENIKSTVVKNANLINENNGNFKVFKNSNKINKNDFNAKKNNIKQEG